MRRVGNLWDDVTSWENLLLAARKAQRGKRDRPAVAAFNFGREFELMELQRTLRDGTYHPGPFSTHWVSRPKPRLISAAPYRDRVVHHAVMNVLSPILDRRFHADSFACRSGKGTHAAADRLQVLMARNTHLVHCDIRKFFPSIDHELLKATFRRIVKDRPLLSLLDLFVDSSNPQEPVVEYFDSDSLFAPAERRRGLPIGNLTSQWFANWFLNDVDFFITGTLHVGGYVRYSDDMVLLDSDRGALIAAIKSLECHLAGKRLRLHESRRRVVPEGAGVTFVGFRTWATHRLLRKATVQRMRRRVRWMRRAFAAGTIQWNDATPRLQSWSAHALQSDSKHLLRRLRREWVFVRGGGGEGRAIAK